MAVIDVEKNWQLLINGEWVDPAGGAYDVVDPATTEVVGHAPEASVVGGWSGEEFLGPKA